MTQFQFKCDDGFALSGRGLILVGRLVSGEIHSKQLIRFPTNRGNRIGRIKKLEIKRVLVDHVASDDHIGILIDKTNDRYLNSILESLPTTEEEAKLYGSAMEKIGLEFPCELTGPVPADQFVMLSGT